MGSLLLAVTVEGGADLPAQAASEHLAQDEDEGDGEEDADGGDDGGGGGGERLHAVGGKQVQSVSVLFSEGVSGEIN